MAEPVTLETLCGKCEQILAMIGDTHELSAVLASYAAD